MTVEPLALYEPEPLARARRDLRQAAATLSLQEVRYLVDTYYEVQRYRIASANQVRALEDGEEPTSLLTWTSAAFATVEDEIRKGLDVFSLHEPSGLGAWARSIVGVGPVLAAGLLAHLDVERAPTVGHFWRFCGLDPTQTWERGQKRPWNASLKVICVLPSSRVTTRRGHIPIAEVAIGDDVLTHRGRWRRVTRVFVNEHHGALYGLRAANAGNQVAWLTAGHPVYAGAATTYRSGRTITVKATEVFDWHAVETIQERWLLSRPVVEDRSVISRVLVLAGVSISAGVVAAGGRWAGVAHALAHHVPAAVPYNPDLMRLLGLFIAEGHIHGNHIGWSFHEDETPLIDFVQRVLREQFDLPSTKAAHPLTHCIQVIATAKPLADSLRSLIGHGSLSNQLPLDWLSLPDDLLWPLWQGIMDGDGDHVGPDAGRRISLKNPSLARAVMDLGRRLGLSVSLHEEPNGACRLYVNQRPDREVRARSTLAMLYDGPVYNLDVEEDHSYVVEGYAVHNCWKLGESWVKVSGNKNDIYGKLYQTRKAYEIGRNDGGDLAEQAALALQKKRIGKTTDAHAAYSTGKLPPAHIHARAKRWAVKAFLADYHHVAFELRYGRRPPFPYPLAHLGHTHERGVPNHTCLEPSPEP